MLIAGPSRKSRAIRALQAILSMGLVLAASLGCQAPAPPVPTSAATSLPQAAAPAPTETTAPAPAAPTQPRPTATTPPKPTAMPTPAPLASLAPEIRATALIGQRAIAGGDYQRALTLLEPLVEQTSSDARAEVRLLLAQAQVGTGASGDALETAKAGQADSARADLAAANRMLEGQALRGLKRYDEAAAVMRSVAETDPTVAPAVRLELADMWLAAGRPDDAAKDAAAGLDAADARLLKIDLAEKLATAHVQRKDVEAAMDAYRQLLTAAGTKGYLGEQLYNLAQGAAALGRTEDAVRALRTSIAEFPRSRKAPDAADLLDQLGRMQPEDRFFAGVIRYQFWQFKQARDDLDAYLAAEPNGDHAVEARYYRALSSPAKESAQRLLDLANSVPDDDFAPMALLEAGKAFEEIEDYSAAETTYQRLVSTYPTRDAGLAGAFRQGLTRYLREDYDGALAIWQDLLNRDPEPGVRSQALFWIGKTHEARGAGDQAQASWTAAAAMRPVDYYVVRATVELRNPPKSTQFDGSAIEPADEQALAQWFASKGLDLDKAGREVETDPSYQRAAALVQIGLFKEANWEFEALLTRYADKPAHLYWLAARFMDLNLPNGALKLGTAALQTATAEGEVSVLDVPAALQRVAYPLAFPDVAGPIAKRNGLDPLLFNSLMRQESDFDPFAESVAKAKGLTQIIPKTGNEIAGALGVSGFEQATLFQPKRSMEFGAYYLGQRQKRNKDVDRTLASYNAGDGNVDNWTTAGREDPDVFAEYVAFAETNDYVKKIYTYWMLTRYIWAG